VPIPPKRTPQLPLSYPIGTPLTFSPPPSRGAHVVSLFPKGPSPFTRSRTSTYIASRSHSSFLSPPLSPFSRPAVPTGRRSPSPQAPDPNCAVSDRHCCISCHRSEEEDSHLLSTLPTELSDTSQPYRFLKHPGVERDVYPGL